jgi:hypothetical protein
MKRLLQLTVVAVAIATGATLVAQSGQELRYDANVDLITLPALGEVAGVATNSRGNIYVYARTGQPAIAIGQERSFLRGGSRLFQFDQTGKFVREIGQGTYAMKFAQSVRVDPQDNVWAVDAGTNTVTKYDSSGNFLLVLGRAPEAVPVRQGQGVKARLIDPDPPPPAPGAGGGGGGGAAMAGRPPGSGPEANSFNRPTDVTFDKAGNVYVADGMGTNNRIAKFSADGNFVKTWGQTGTGQGQFTKIMGIASDAAGNIYVADAGNKRIQVFDGEGNFKSQITGIGTPLAICISGGPTQHLYSSNSNDPESMDNGEIYKVTLDGKIVGRFGKAGRIPGEFGMVNSLDCRNDSNVLVGEVWNWRVTKVTLK